MQERIIIFSFIKLIRKFKLNLFLNYLNFINRLKKIYNFLFKIKKNININKYNKKLTLNKYYLKFIF